MGAFWVPASGFEGRYEVSAAGEIRSLLTNRILQPGVQSRGYMVVGLYTGAVPKQQISTLVHRLVWESLRGPIPDGKQVNHIDGNKLNNRLENLELATPAENVGHANANGLQPKRYRGSRHANSKLTEEDVTIMLAASRAGMTPTQLGRAFKIDPVRAGQIIRGEAWQHVARPSLN